MRKEYIVGLTLSCLIFLFPSCAKKKGCKDPMSLNYDASAEVDDGSCQNAGSGGNTTIVLFPHHHTVPVPNKASYLDTAYVKFNAVNLPGTTAGYYDQVIVGEAGEDHIHLPGLKPGKYFIYVTGYDSIGGFRVFGGLPYTLTQSTGEVDIDPFAISEQ